MKDRERRIISSGVKLEERAGSRPRLTGYGLVFERESEPLGGFTEVISRDVVIEPFEDVVATFNHNPNALLGRQSSGTLELKRDERGIFYSIDVPETSIGKDVRELVSRGDIAGSSFTFDALEDSWQRENGINVRTLRRIAVYELGPVTFPAYPDTTAAARCLASWADRTRPGVNVEPPRSRTRLHLRRREQELAELDRMDSLE